MTAACDFHNRRSARIRCPTLVIHGNLDLIRPHAKGKALADTQENLGPLTSILER